MKPRQDFDSPWKDILEAQFREFMAFFLPRAHADIDWSQKPVFLDKEMQAIASRGIKGRRFVDKLVRVTLKSGAKAQVLVHVEVQAAPEDDVAKRMYVYNSRSFDRYGFQVASVLVLLDDHPSWRPGSFGYQLFDTDLRFQYPVFKVSDWAARREELERSDNPFATVVLTQLAVRQTGKDPPQRLESKWALVRRLYKKGFRHVEIAALLRFIDGLIALPEALEAEFWDRYKRQREKKNMPHVLSIERLAEKKGRHEGTVGALRAAILGVLKARFGTLPKSVLQELQKVTDQDRLESLVHDAALAGSVAEIEANLTGRSPACRTRKPKAAPRRRS